MSYNGRAGVPLRLLLDERSSRVVLGFAVQVARALPVALVHVHVRLVDVVIVVIRIPTAPLRVDPANTTGYHTHPHWN